MITIHHTYDLSGRNTFRMKVRCALYVEITEEADLPALDWDALPRPLMVIGGGSNLLFTGDFPGTVLHFAGGGTDTMPAGEVGAIFGRGLSGPAASGDFLTTVPAGTVFDDFCAWAAAEGLWGPENLSLIPGEVGASAVQNIGAYGVEAKDIIAEIRAWDLQERCFVTIDPADCAYGYRTSRFKTEWKGRFLITAVTYRLSKDPKPILDYGGIRKALADRGVSTRAETASASLRPLPYSALRASLGPSRSGRKALPPIVPQGTFALTGSGRGWPEVSAPVLTPQLIRDTIIDIRRKKLPDPAEKGSAGSFFCNPVISREHFARIEAIARGENGAEYKVPHYEVGDQIKVPAAWMIEQCGFKGAVNGGAKVYENQPLVIVNDSGSASPEEIIGLERRIIDTIEKKYGITLHPEVEHI